MAPPPTAVELTTRPSATTTVRSVCSYCGVGCGIVLEVATDETGRRRAVRSAGDPDHPTNAGRLCTKGVTSADMLAAPGRTTTGLARVDRERPLAPIPTDEAITRAATGLRRVLDEHGPDAIALYVSGQMTIEAQYLATKLAKGFIGTNQIESNSRLCMASAASGYKLSLGADGPPGSYDDLDHADVFLVIGSNMADCHPILWLRLLDRLEAGARLIVVDPRRTATAERADLHLQLRPGTDLVLLNGLLHLVAAGGRLDEAFIADHTEGWEDMPALLADHDPATVAAITGLAEDDVRAAAAMIGGAADWVTCWTMGLNQSVQGTWNTNAICNLHLATGAIGRRGSGPLSLTGQPNAMGGREMGYMGPGLPGQRSVLAAADREFVERLWSVPAGTVRTEPGRGTVDLFRRMGAGEVKACWIMCTNPIASVANRGTVIAGLEAAELVITQDAFADTETNAYADIVLPAAMWAEGDGVMVNSERSLTLSPRAVDPPGDALPDWELIARVATAMGFGDAFAYTSAEEIFEEIRACSNPATGYDLGGASYERLRQEPVQWPAAAGGPARNPVRDRRAGELRFPTTSGRARFHPRAHGAGAEQPDDEFPFTFNTGRLAHQWHTMTKTGKVARLNRLNPAPFVEIHPDDASTLGIAAGDDVQVASRRGRAVLPAVLTDRVRPGTCFAPFHWADLYGEYASVNAVTDDAVDPISFQPGFKVCAVSLTKVATRPTATESSLDDHQHRYLAGFLAGLDAPGAAPGVPVLPSGAPFPPDVALWIDGWLAGRCSRAATPEPPGVAATTAASSGRRAVIVLWSSQTGTAEQVAVALHRRLVDSGADAALHAMDTGRLDLLRAGTDVLVVTSTFGAGDAPDNGAALWRALTAADAPSLAGVRFAVLALGDSNYRDFCGHGRRLDERLADLGAERLLGRVDCEPWAVDTVAPRWFDRVLDGLDRAPIDAEARITVGPRRSFEACHHGEAPTQSRPLLARVAGNRVLTGPGSAKEIREVVIDTAGSALTYEAGDSLGVWPANCPDLVAEWLGLMGSSGDEVVDVGGIGEVAIADALRDHLEITRTTPELIRFLGEHTNDRDLQLLARAGDGDAVARWTWGRQAVDVARDVGVRADAATWVRVFRRLQPRQYSISSSPLTHPHRIRLTASIVRFHAGERRRKGACSSYLADSPPDAAVPVFVQPARHFRPPADPSRATIMIGPGTGIAPFIGFLEERRARGDHGANWLFFGEQRQATDHLYADELAEFRRDGVLHRLDLAFSRDQRAKVYIQDRLREHGAHVWSWLQDGAHLYVCGDATRMAGDVDRTLRDIAVVHGGLTSEEAVGYLRQLSAERRYARDVY